MSSFEQTMMSWSPQCYIPSFVEIGSPVQEKKIFVGFFIIYGRGGHLGHVTSIMSSDFHFLVPKSFHKKLVQIGTAVSEKIRLEFLYVHDLGPRSRNDLDLLYSQTYIYSIRCLLLLTFRSLAAMVSEKFTVFTFSYRKTSDTKFDLAVK